MFGSGGIISPSSLCALPGVIWLTPNVLPILESVGDAAKARQLRIDHCYDLGLGISAHSATTRGPPDHLAIEYKGPRRSCDDSCASRRGVKSGCQYTVVHQRLRGWRALPDRYDDGGFSGGDMERPGLQRLLADVDAGKVDVIVVYKIDRLSRSLLDFMKMIERFNQTGVSFVSVTQHFNTTDPTGRMFLGILITFAQYEREVIGPRSGGGHGRLARPSFRPGGAS